MSVAITNELLAVWLARLEARSGQAGDRDASLQRLSDYVTARGWQQLPGPVISITGTNGKGSVVALLEACYRQAGYATVTFTSPHLFRFNERLCFDNQPIDDAALLTALTSLLPVCEQLSLNYFQSVFLIALSVLQVKPARPTVYVFEVGVGGRFDPVRLLESALTVITTVALDHQALLGNTREAIAYEKAGLMQAGIPVIYGQASPPSPIAERAEQLDCPLLVRDKAFSVEENLAVAGTEHWHWQSPDAFIRDLPLPVLALDNAAIALMALTVLQPQLPVGEAAIRAGLKAARLPGRLHAVTTGAINYLYDVAHNAQAFRQLAGTLTKCFAQSGAASAPRCQLVLGMYEDKITDQPLFDALLPLVDGWHAVSFTRDACGKAVCSLRQAVTGAASSKQSAAFDDYACLTEAFSAARAKAQPGDWIVICGSFKTVAAGYQYFESPCN